MELQKKVCVVNFGFQIFQLKANSSKSGCHTHAVLDFGRRLEQSQLKANSSKSGCHTHAVLDFGRRLEQRTGNAEEEEEAGQD